MKETKPAKATQNIVISNPDGENLEGMLAGSLLSPQLLKFLRHVVRTNKWTRKITIPSTPDDVAVVLLFSSSLKEGGLEILNEIHVFFNGKTVTEKWEVLPETEHASALQPEFFSASDVEKVRVEGALVHVDLSVLTLTGEQKKVVKTYDFSFAEPSIHGEALPGNNRGSRDERAVV